MQEKKTFYTDFIAEDEYGVNPNGEEECVRCLDCS